MKPMKISSELVESNFTHTKLYKIQLPVYVPVIKNNNRDIFVPWRMLPLKNSYE